MSNPRIGARHLVGLALCLLGLTGCLILPCYASSPRAQSAFASNANAFDAGTSRRGVFKSAEVGANLTALNDGLTNLTVPTVAIDPSGTQLHASTSAGAFNYQSSSGFTIGLFRPSDSRFFLRNSNTFGTPDITVDFGAPDDLPIVGDWDGNGTVTIGLYRPSSSTFFLRNANTSGPPDITVSFGDGPGGDVPVAGDWDGNGTWTIGVYRPATSTFFLRNSNSFGVPAIVVTFGAPDDMPIVGDWDGNGTMTIGLFRPSENLFFLRNTNNTGIPDITVPLGAPDDLPIVGDWDGNGTTTIGLFRPEGNSFFLWNSNTVAPPDITVGGFGAPGDKPIAGNWDVQSSAFDFLLQLSASNAVITCGPSNPVDYGCGAEIGITPIRLGGNPQPVMLSVEGLPEYAYSYFLSNPVTTGSSTSLLIGMYPQGPATYTMTVVGASGNLIRRAFFELIVPEEPNLSSRVGLVLRAEDGVYNRTTTPQ